MNIGKLNKRVTIEQPPTGNTGGIASGEWTEVATVWASVEPLQGREFFAARETAANLSHKVTVRYRAGITSAMRVKYGERTFAIQAVIDPGERHAELQLMCLERI